MHGNKIVLDLEFTPIRDAALHTVANNEIIEIGAVRLDADNRFVDTFQTYVKPQYSCIPPHITKITGITEDTVQAAPSYAEAMEAFTAWIALRELGRFYTWSITDQYVLLHESVLKKVALHPMYSAYWVDLQRIHRRLYGFARPMNLSGALGSMQIFFEGTEHGALADAKNTAKILQQLSDVQAVQNRIAQSHITYNADNAHGFSLEALLLKRK